MIRLVARDEANVLTLYPGHFSADLASLAGRLRAAEARGEQGRIEISPALLARRDEALKLSRTATGCLDAFFAQAEARFAGRNVMILGVKTMMYDWAEAGLKRGLRGLFGPDSVLITGGGSKGRDLPDDAAETIAEFLGFSNATKYYGMSELTGFSRRCEAGVYHVPPYVVPYVLDPAERRTRAAVRPADGAVRLRGPVPVGPFGAAFSPATR